MPWFTPELEPLLAIAAATLDENGTLIEANAGFLKLIEPAGPHPIGMCVCRLFIQPDWTSLTRPSSGPDGQIHNGLLTIGDPKGRTRTLRGRVWRIEGRIRVLAEHNIAELEGIYDTVLDLNRQYADAQLELAQTNLKLQQREEEIVALSLTDPLTGVGNRRRLDQTLALEISRAGRTGLPLCAFMADIDHFKRVNDVHGHGAGDRVLVAFGELLRRQTRATDLVARYGGEEFVALMPHTDLDHAVATAERIRIAFADCRVEPIHDPVTASFGVVRLVTGEKGEALLRRADEALYAAKQSGRNRVVAA